MTLNRISQYADVLLSCFLIIRISRLHLWSKYGAFLVFVAFGSIESIIYLVAAYFSSKGFQVPDYRILWCAMLLIAWTTTIWMVYALLTSILKQLPGILRFSVRLLNITFGVAIIIALMTVRPEYSVSVEAVSPDWKARMTAFAMVMERAFSFAELLVILAILTFVLFFPIRVPRNLAAFGAGLSIYLVLRIAELLAQTYLPAKFYSVNFDPLPFVIDACLVYWIVMINPAGETSSATLGRTWQSVPKDHLVRQLEAMNAALLHSREQT